MSSYVSDMLLTHLRDLTSQLGSDGGLIGPSVYDTAQVLRKAPPPEGVWEALEWLITQQQADGGWGDPAFPLARDVPTLAAILAIHQYSTRVHEQKVINAGIQFLWQHAFQHWSIHLPEALPVAIELLLPQLVNEAIEAGLDVPTGPYEALFSVGQKRQKALASRDIPANTTAVHTWEAWGNYPDPKYLDHYGGVGHNPAATAAWLQAAQAHPELADACVIAQRYLAQASAATITNIPGVVPTVWPITRFEQSNSLYALLISGMLDHPGLKDIIPDKLTSLLKAFTPTGLGMSDIFMSDGDDTAEGLAVLHTMGYDAPIHILDKFAYNSHFAAYPGELQPSISVTAHALHTLNLTGQTRLETEAYLIERQQNNGTWSSDKWNSSWLYTTSHIMIAINHPRNGDALKRAMHAILINQQPDGSWGSGTPNAEETAYAIIALRQNLHNPTLSVFNERMIKSLSIAEQWMLDNYRPFHTSYKPIWLGKEIYRAYRLSRIIELVATFPSQDIPNKPSI
jgi:hypothetical protein